MRQIRKNIFETNSSSVHAISISPMPYELPTETLRFYFGKYGWSSPDLTTTEERLSYLYTYICCFGNDIAEKYLNILLDWFKNDNIKYVFHKYPDYDEYRQLIYGYVDHQSLLLENLENLFTDKDTVYRFLFSPESAVCIDNDNNDMEHIKNFIKEKPSAFYL